MGCSCSRHKDNDDVAPTVVDIANVAVAAPLEGGRGKSVAVIGGGIAGLSAAYYLAKAGFKVHVYEKNTTTGGMTSYGPAAVTMWKGISKPFDWAGTTDLSAAGDVSSAIELAEGMAWSMLEKDPNHAVTVGQAKAVFDAFIIDNPDSAPIINKDGLLYLLTETYFHKNKKLHGSNPNMVFYTKAEFEASDVFDPLFEGANYYGVLHCKEEGYVDPQSLVHFLAEKVQGMGGEITCGVTVEKLSETEQGVTVIGKEGMTLATVDKCVVALGAFPGKLLKASGFNDGVEEIFGIKGYSITGRMPEGTLRRGVVDATDTKFIRPFVDKNGNYCIRFGGIADPYDDRDPLDIKWDRMEEFKHNQLARKLFEHNKYPSKQTADTTYDLTVQEGTVEVWAGIRPVNRHGMRPLVRKVKDAEHTMVVSGFGSNGFVMCWYAGPAVAKMAAL